MSLPTAVQTPAAPLLKWPGGKRRERARIVGLIPGDIRRYFEPFVGAGAVLFAIAPSTPAYVNDTSVELMDLYALVRRRDPALFRHLDGLAAWWDALEGFVGARARALVEQFAAGSADGDEQLVGAAAGLLSARGVELDATVAAPWRDLTDEFRADAGTLVPRKLRRMRDVERRRGQRLPVDDVWSNVEGAFKAAAYTTLRRAYNAGRRGGVRSGRQTALFYFLREYAYAAMFRFNADGDFNVPYGGLTYNRKRLGPKVEHLRSDVVVRRLDTAVLGCEDFERFLDRHPPAPDDYVFLDPPYDTDFADYDRRVFALDHHARLASVMRALPCRFQLVIKATPDVRRIYADPRWHVRSVDMVYGWTIKARNDRRATHLVVTNYAPAEVGDG